MVFYSFDNSVIICKPDRSLQSNSSYIQASVCFVSVAHLTRDMVPFVISRLLYIADGCSFRR